MKNIFLEQVQPELDRLQNEIKSRRLYEVQQISHKLKFTVSLLGAQSMRARLKEIEEIMASLE